MVCLLGIFSNKVKFNIDTLKDNFTKAKSKFEVIAFLGNDDFGQRQENIVEVAIKLRDILLSGVSLSPNEKIDVVRLINQAKIKSAMLGTTDGYRTYQILDSISEDIRRYL